MELEELERVSASALRYIPYLDAEGIVRGIEAYNEAIRRVARGSGAILLEGDGVVAPDDENFIDAVHLLDPGCIALADALLLQLSEHHAETRPVEATFQVQVPR